MRYLYWNESPEAALFYVLDYRKEPHDPAKGMTAETQWPVRLLHSYDQLGGGVAGSYQLTSRASLTGRKYRVELVDDCVAIHFTDLVYDSHNLKHILKDQ